MVEPRVIPFAFPGLPAVRCVFMTRQGGLSEAPYNEANISYEVGDDHDRVLANRKGLRSLLGFESATELKQVHGPVMVFDPTPGSFCAPGEAPAALEEADGVTTTRPGHALVIKTADCQPLMLAHAGGGHIAALHVGWRGNRLGFPATGVRAFCEHYGLDPAEVLAVRGPSLGPAASEFVNFADEWGAAFEGSYDVVSQCVDLWAMTREQLLEAGLLEKHVFSLDLCTHSLRDLFFSYRRRGTTGRMANLIWISGHASAGDWSRMETTGRGNVR